MSSMAALALMAATPQDNPHFELITLAVEQQYWIGYCLAQVTDEAAANARRAFWDEFGTSPDLRDEGDKAYYRGIQKAQEEPPSPQRCKAGLEGNSANQKAEAERLSEQGLLSHP